MPSRNERIALLAEANRARTARKRGHVQDALRAMHKAGLTINVSTVAVRAGVSRNFIYQQADLLSSVQRSADTQPGRLDRPRSSSSSSEASLRSRLVTALDALAASRQEAQELSAKVERLTGEVARLMVLVPMEGDEGTRTGRTQANARI
ncbi:DUF6262 family protein [Sinomonas atrocyanea]|uniref:DUF6262 family protein n=1 Tax=Sinomonas atrocyanea TaxID=37927 RepID=UPI00352AD909